MCRRISCNRCNKITWSGCGAHVDSVLRGVPMEDRCSCDAAKPSKASSAASGSTAGPSWWSSLFGGK
jgi:hypothetical protein